MQKLQIFSAANLFGIAGVLSTIYAFTSSPRIASGTAITAEKGVVTDVYGEGVTAGKVLKMEKDKAPKEVQAFPDMVATYSGAKQAKK